MTEQSNNTTPKFELVSYLKDAKGWEEKLNKLFGFYHPAHHPEGFSVGFNVISNYICKLTDPTERAEWKGYYHYHVNSLLTDLDTGIIKGQIKGTAGGMIEEYRNRVRNNMHPEPVKEAVEEVTPVQHPALAHDYLTVQPGTLSWLWMKSSSEDFDKVMKEQLEYVRKTVMTELGFTDPEQLQPVGLLLYLSQLAGCKGRHLGEFSQTLKGKTREELLNQLNWFNLLTFVNTYLKYYAADVMDHPEEIIARALQSINS